VAGLRWLCTIALIVVGAVAPGTAGATATPGVSAQATANVTDATTGIPDASSSVVARNACSAPGPGQATCLAQYLATRGTRVPIRPRLRPAASPYRFTRPHAHSRRTTTPLAMPAAAPQPGTPAYMQQAYDLSYLSQTAGTGQTVAIVDAFNDPSAQDDLDKYRSTFGLPACDNGCFQKVDQTGGTNYPTADNDWDLEISLDLDAVSALCPNCHILLVEAKSFSPNNMLAAQQTAKNLGATVISDSWRMLPTTPSQQSFFEHAAFTFSGIATVAASGDTGYLGVGSDPTCSPQGVPVSPTTLCNAYPAALPNVTAVGGTTLAPASGARGFGESAWVWKNPATKVPPIDGATGSGCDTTATKPTWQTDTGCTGRAYNDISADGDPATGMLVYDPSYPGSPTDGWLVVGGTSEAAPLISAYYALVGATGATPSWPYDSSKMLNDPTGGSNGPCDPLSPYICTALSGYDGPTGAGSISGAVVKGAPGIGGPGANGSYTQSVSANGAQLQGGVYPNDSQGDQTTYWWEYGTTNSYGQETPHTNIASGSAPVAVASVLTGLLPGTTYHYRLVAENSLGTEAGYDFTFTTAPDTTVAPPPTVVTTTTTTTTTKPPPTTSIKTITTRPPPISSTASAPSLGTLRILALGGGSATASATINTHGGATGYYLAYGTTRKLGRRSASGSSTSSRTVTWHMRGLVAGKVYYLQVVAANSGGSTRSSMVRVRTSPVNVARITRSGAKLAVLLRCSGPAACGGRLTVKIGARLIAGVNFRVPGNHKTTVPLKLNRAAVARAGHGKKLQATLSAVTVYNGYAATVSAKFRLVAPA
jgi:hypothetical protein